MNGYYQSKTSGEIYHVYGKGFDYFAECIQSVVKPTGKPFKIDKGHIEVYLKRKSWVEIQNPEKK